MTQSKKIKAFEKFVKNRLDYFFPKDKCKERGNALVYYAEISMFVHSLFDIKQK